MTAHRPGNLHQSNKRYKSRHRTKGELKTAAKGKVPTGAPTHRKSVKQTSSKVDRRNAAKLQRDRIKTERLLEHRFFCGRYKATKLIALVALCPDIDMAPLMASMSQADGVQILPNPGKHLQLEFDGQRFLLMSLSRQDLAPSAYFMDALRACQVADYVLPVASADVEVDELGERLLEAISAQGCSTMATVVQHLEKEKAKKQMAVRKSIAGFIQHRFPDADKVFALGQDAVALLRYLARTRPQGIHWRDQHPYMLAEHVQISGENRDQVELVFEGVVRGMALHTDRLLHCASLGDLRISRAEILEAARAPSKKERTSAMDVDEGGVAASPAIERAVLPSLTGADIVHELTPDPMACEQTWPTEEELQEADERVRQMKKRTRLLPTGTSSYQAAWISDEEGDGSEGQEDEDINEEFYEDGDDMWSDEEEHDQDVQGNEEANASEPSSDEDDEYQHELAERLAHRAQESRRDEFIREAQFPDEKDTPLNIPARERFQKYRGLKRFKTATWDPYENLPEDYARIYQFEDFNRMKRRVLQSLEEETLMCSKEQQPIEEGSMLDPSASTPLVPVGRRVRIYATLTNETDMEHIQSAVDGTAGSPLILFGLLPHEEKMSVINFTCKRTKAANADEEDEEDEEENIKVLEPIIRSKDELLIHCGFRAFMNRPVYSQHTQTAIHKFERFLVHGHPSVGTMFAPVVFPPSPILMFQPLTSPTEIPQLVAHGSVLSVDPNRVIVKRIVLTGYPTKLNKASRHSLNTAVVRYMFFNPEDIAYFKPVELRTKEGRYGHILDSIGTHGAMKCSFERMIQQSDTVCLLLYKRVYPKWPERGYRGLVQNSKAYFEEVNEDAAAMDMEESK